MYICICKQVTDKEIQEAIRKHHCRTVIELHNLLGVCINCCKCKEAIEELLEDDRKRRERECANDIF